MRKFVIHPQHGVKQVSVIVWDAADDKELCAFVDGEFETEDQAVIDKLEALGYEGFATGGFITGETAILGDNGKDEVIIQLDAEVLKSIVFSDEEIRAKAKELGIGNWHNKKIDNLKEEIKEITER